MNKLKIEFWNNFEVIIVLILSALLTFIAFINRSFLIFIIEKKNLNEIIIGLSGSLLGLLITAYAIFFAIIPTLSKNLIDSKHFLRINVIFFVSIFGMFTTLIIGLIYPFVSDEKILELFAICGVFFFSFSLILIFVLSTILYIIFLLIRNKLITSKPST